MYLLPKVINNQKQYYYYLNYALYVLVLKKQTSILHTEVSYAQYIRLLKKEIFKLKT
jgi:hypothetical protein